MWHALDRPSPGERACFLCTSRLNEGRTEFP